MSQYRFFPLQYLFFLTWKQPFGFFPMTHLWWRQSHSRWNEIKETELFRHSFVRCTWSKTTAKFSSRSICHVIGNFKAEQNYDSLIILVGGRLRESTLQKNKRKPCKTDLSIKIKKKSFNASNRQCKYILSKTYLCNYISVFDFLFDYLESLTVVILWQQEFQEKIRLFRGALPRKLS